MNWLMRMSLRLLGTPQRKNSAVTRTKGSIRPPGTRGALLCLFDKDAVPELADPIGKLKVKSSSARGWRNAASSLTLKKTLKWRQRLLSFSIGSSARVANEAPAAMEKVPSGEDCSGD